MTDVRESTDALLDEKPELESALREVLDVDDRTDGWSFDDIPLDSGTFGELVSRGIVAKNGDEYEVVDPQAVRASLDGDSGEPNETRTAISVPFPSEIPFSTSREKIGVFGAALLLVVLMRTYFYSHIFRPDGVLLSSNDPYYYRYWVEKLASEATGVFDFSVLSGLPAPVAKGEPLTVATLWWLTNLFGGGDASGVVLAWYPVISAIAVAVLVYAIALRLTGDYRVGIASMVLLAVIPAFAYRTGLGFADHHAFDYPWLALTALALVLLAEVERESLSTIQPWTVAGGLGIAVTFQILAWEAGPLLVGALGLYVAVKGILDVQANRSPLLVNSPILAGLAVASVLSHLAHVGFGWHTEIVAYSPALLLVGMSAVLLVAEAVKRMNVTVKTLGGIEVAGAIGGYLALGALLPAYATQLKERIGYLLFRSGPAETKSMFAGGPKGVFLGPILELGFAWILGLPILVVASWRAYHRDYSKWLVIAVYSWYFLVLSAFQRRFVGELAPFIAILAGWGLIAFAAKLEIIDQPVFNRESNDPTTDSTVSFNIPSRKTAVTLSILVLFVTSAGAVQTTVRHEQVKIDGDKYRAAQWIDDYADERGLDYPQNYVLSKWGRNRMYNYFVNGRSRSYAFAKDHYQPFLASKNPKDQYTELRDRVGFVVTKDLDLVSQAPKNSMYARLHKRFGSVGTNGGKGTGHYQAVYASNDRSVKVFALVPGATIIGTAAPGETVTISKEVRIEGQKFVYRREARTNPYGVYSLTVPYTGEYRVQGATKVTPQDSVSIGKKVKWHERKGIAHWPFDKTRNGNAYDRVGTHRGTIAGDVSKKDGVKGRALAFEGTANSHVNANVTAPQQFTVSLWIRPQTLDATTGNDYRHVIGSKRGWFLILEENGQVSFRVPGVESQNYIAGQAEVGKWTHVTATYNGTHRTIYVDGQRVGSNRIGNGTVSWGGQLRIGAGYTGGAHAFNGSIDEVRIYGHALSPEEVRQRYDAVNGTAS